MNTSKSSQSKKLANKSILITGAAKGIGAKTAQLLAQHGATVFVSDLSLDQSRQITTGIENDGNQAIPIELDVRSEISWNRALEKVLKVCGHLDVLVNNAGILLAKDFEEASLEDWHNIVAVNMTGVFLGTKVCAPALRDSSRNSSHGSSIINLSSVAGLVAAPNDALYAMTKGGVTTFTKSTAVSFANKGDRIRVNSIHPGVVETDMGNQAMIAQAKRLGASDSVEMKQLSADRHPVGRIANPSEIANAILFLASDDSSFVTGASIPVDGGYTAQ